MVDGGLDVSDMNASHESFFLEMRDHSLAIFLACAASPSKVFPAQYFEKTFANALVLASRGVSNTFTKGSSSRRLLHQEARLIGVATDDINQIVNT
jgi:hypothetical protein